MPERSESVSASPERPGRGPGGRPEAAGKPERPRDELGRPLPWDEPTRLHLAEFDSLSVDENHRLGIEYFDDRQFFPAHEAWETCWKQSKGTADEEFFKGLSQLGAGYTHYFRGNPHGTFTLLRRGGSRVTRYPSPHLGVDSERLATVALAQADEVERAHRAGTAMPELAFPVIGSPA
jgi:predicted metal-dependent hydrolase